uniref:Uncharacterized protein n=1 Tax=Anguilla anguilla TaxID=7936 RepID=A0A0E9PHR2_ANGAN
MHTAVLFVRFSRKPPIFIFFACNKDEEFRFRVGELAIPMQTVCSASVVA